MSNLKLRMNNMSILCISAGILKMFCYQIKLWTLS